VASNPTPDPPTSFHAEPWGHRLPAEAVLCSLADPSLVTHFAHAECPEETPHAFETCGLCQPRPDGGVR
jgi:hypothetical protein